MAYEIEEKQYETAANLEIARTCPVLYSPGQVLEKLLGFDVAAAPSPQSLIWTLLQAGVPPGIALNPNYWMRGRQPLPNLLPSYAVSLILQYKRSEHCPSPRAAQRGHWNQPYYRFAVSPSQHTTLIAFEAALNASALVRYAAPVFHTYNDLEANQVRGAVLTSSTFVSPMAVGATHQIWSFIRPGTLGWANQNGEEVESEGWKELYDSIIIKGSKANVLSHLHEMAGGFLTLRLGRALPTPKMLTVGDKKIEDQKAIQAVFNLLYIARAMNLVGATWWMAVFEREPDS